jgi:sec-independent protein translocase protein TatB
MTTGELFLIFLAIFILFGPQKIPEIARKLAKGIQKIKIAAEDITDEVNKTVNPLKEELKAQADKLKEELDIKSTEKASEKKTDTILSNQSKNLIG